MGCFVNRVVPQQQCYLRNGGWITQKLYGLVGGSVCGCYGPPQHLVHRSCLRPSSLARPLFLKVCSVAHWCAVRQSEVCRGEQQNSKWPTLKEQATFFFFFGQQKILGVPQKKKLLFKKH